MLRSHIADPNLFRFEALLFFVVVKYIIYFQDQFKKES